MVAFLCPAPFFKSGYTPNAVIFDGTNDYLARGSGLSGAADSANGMCFFWFKTTSSSDKILMQNALGSYISFLSNGKIEMILSGTGGETLGFTTTNAYNDGSWHSCLIAWQSNFSAGNKVLQVYIDDVAIAFTKYDASASFTVDYTTTNWWIGCSSGLSQILNASIAEFYYASGQYLNLSTAANRRGFVTAANKPVSLGATGSAPTGSQPIVYLNNAAASFATNKGSGGNFTLTGTLVDTTPPS